jgi:uncharacterized protein YggE
VISVRGEAVFEVEPEIAVVWVSVHARDRDRDRAVQLLAERNARVTGLIKGFGVAVEKLESGPVRVHPELKDAKGKERVAGYLASAAVQATVADFAAVGDLVTALAEADMVTVAGPEWRLRPGSPAYREARLAAARDATQRAREYAEAFGGRITGLVEAADTGLMGAEPRRLAFSAAAKASHRAAAAGEGPALDFEPAKQTVSAQVEARYTMTAPEFGG